MGMHYRILNSYGSSSMRFLNVQLALRLDCKRIRGPNSEDTKV